MLLECAITYSHYKPTKVGAIRAFLNEEQAGWLPCVGQAVDKDLYAELFSVVGLRYQTENRPFAGDNKFYIPDLTDRFTYYSDKHFKGQYLESDGNPIHTHTAHCGEAADHIHFLTLMLTQSNHNGTGAPNLHAYSYRDEIDRKKPREQMVPSGEHEHFALSGVEGTEEFAPTSSRVKYFIKF